MLVCDYVYIYIYIHRKISFCFLLLLEIFEHIANEIFLIFNINCFEFSSDDQSRERRWRFKYIRVYRKLIFENYAIQGI